MTMPDHAQSPSRPQGAAIATARDPVCGMSVDPATAKHRLTHSGQEYFFCCGRCREKFAADPDAVSAPGGTEAGRSPGAAPGMSRWTCPMHPRDRPRTGPAAARSAAWRWSRPARPADRAQPRTARHDPALLDRRGAGGADAGARDGRAFPRSRSPPYMPPPLSIWIEFVLATPVVVWAGWPFFVRGWASVRNRSLNMFSLISLGDRRRLSLQPGRDLRARAVPGRAARRGRRRSRSISRRPRSSRCSCCSARCSSCARASRPAAPSARC